MGRKRKKIKMIFKLFIYLSMLVGIPLVLMGTFLGSSSNKNLEQTSSQLSKLSMHSIKNTGDTLVGLTENVINQSSNDSINLNNKTINATSQTLLKLSNKSIGDANKQLGSLCVSTVTQTNNDIINVTEKSFRNTGENLIKLSQKEIEQSISKLLEAKAEAIVEKTNLSIENIKDVLPFIAKIPAVKTFDITQAEPLFNSLLKTYPSVSAVTLIDKTGQEMSKISQESYYTSADFKNVASTPGFEAAIKGKTYISNVKISSRSYPYVTVSVPVPLFVGRYVGVLQADVNLSEIGDLVTGTKIGNTGYAFIVDNNGQVLFHPNKQLVLQKANLSSHPVVKAFKSGNSNRKIFVLSDGQEVLGTGTPIKSLSWTVIVIQPTQEAFAVARSMRAEISTQTNNTLALTRNAVASSIKTTIASMEIQSKKASDSSQKAMIELSKKQLEDSLVSMTQNAKQTMDTAVSRLKPITEKKSKETLEELQTKSKEAASNAQKKLILQTVLIILFFMAIAVYVSQIIAKNIANPIQAMTKIANRIAKDDLTEKVEVVDYEEEELDELSNAFGTMQGNLKHIISQISESSTQVSVSSADLKNIIEQTSKAVENVTMAIQEIAKGTEDQTKLSSNTLNVALDISEEISQISENMGSVNDSSVNANETALLGSKEIEKIINHMNIIDKNVSNLANTISSLSQKSEQISKTVKLIANISQQTNLLSLNAAIEAARAGEQAKGFTVISDEIRNLSVQTSDATKQIGKVVNEIQDEIEIAVVNMDAGITSVQEGLELTDSTGKSFEGIVNAIEDVNLKANDVTSRVAKINNDVQSMVKMIKNITEISNKNASGTQDIAAASEEQTASMEEIAATTQLLSDMSEKLTDLVKTFKI